MINPIQTSTSFTGLNSHPRRHGRVTLAEVATQAGVTTMTVSRFLREPQLVAPDTASKIAIALKETGYIPNLQAGSLASGRSQAVAVIVPNMAHSIFADTLHGLGEGLQTAGLHMLVSSTGYSLALEEQQIRNVLGWVPAALVVTGRAHLPGTQQLLQSAHQRGTPVVEIWDQSPPNESFSFQQIGFDHKQVGAQMALALIERGSDHLTFIDSGVSEDFRAHERAAGFVAEAKRSRIPVEHLIAGAGDPVAQAGECFTLWRSHHLIKRRYGIGFANDLLATGALLHAKSLDCQIPEEIQLLGFGNFALGRYCLGGLSTMHIDGEQIGQACANYIVEGLKQGSKPEATSPTQVVIQPQLIWRMS